jgi:hypothetical protein
MVSRVAAVALGVVGFFALSVTTFAAPQHSKDSYEAMGSKPGMAPPVPGFALSGYRPGLCWKVFSNDSQKGTYVPCSQWHKKRGE